MIGLGGTGEHLQAEAEPIAMEAVGIGEGLIQLKGVLAVVAEADRLQGADQHWGVIAIADLKPEAGGGAAAAWIAAPDRDQIRSHLIVVGTGLQLQTAGVAPAAQSHPPFRWITLHPSQAHPAHRLLSNLEIHQCQLLGVAHPQHHLQQPFLVLISKRGADAQGRG